MSAPHGLAPAMDRHRSVGGFFYVKCKSFRRFASHILSMSENCLPRVALTGCDVAASYFSFPSSRASGHLEGLGAIRAFLMERRPRILAEMEPNAEPEPHA